MARALAFLRSFYSLRVPPHADLITTGLTCDKFRGNVPHSSKSITLLRPIRIDEYIRQPLFERPPPWLIRWAMPCSILPFHRTRVRSGRWLAVSRIGPEIDEQKARTHLHGRSGLSHELQVMRRGQWSPGSGALKTSPSTTRQPIP